MFVLGAPLVGMVLQRLDARPLVVVSLVLAGSSWSYLTENETRPLVGRRTVLQVTRLEQRLMYSPPAYVDAARVVSATGCDRVGLVMGGSDREYLVWDLLPEVRLRGRLEHVLVTNESARFIARGGAGFRPCALIRVNPRVMETLSVGSQSFVSVWSREEVQVLVERRPVAADGQRARRDLSQDDST